MPPHSAALFHYLRRLAGPAPADAELLRRWNERRDEDAFTALVARHGRMVHGVCRRVLGNSHDADDAFQAVFLILARKAGTLRQPEALACWLHGVALRLAGKARAAASRRPCADLSTPIRDQRDPQADPLDALSARELLSLIDREIAALPECYRLPLLLCDVEERSQPEAARLLGWTLGSLRGRLLRGRAKLRKRLLRRGVTPETLSVLLAAGLTQANADAAVPTALAAGATRLALLFSDCPTSAAIPVSVAALVRTGLRGMMLMKLKILSVVFLTAGMLTAGVGLLTRNALAPVTPEEHTQSKPPSPPAAAVPSAEEKKPQVRHDQAGDPLPDGAIARLGTTRFRHGAMVDCLAFAADGKTLVSCSPFNGMRFWDAATGKEIQRFPEQTLSHEMALSPDGKWLAITVRRDNPKDPRIAIRDFASGRLLRRFGTPQTPADLLFTPDGKVLAAFQWEKDIELWDPATGRHMHTLKGHTDYVWSVASFADSKTLVSTSDDKTIRFWDVATGKQLRQIKHNQGIGKIALSPDGKLLATIDFLKEEYPGGGTGWPPDRRVRLWDAASGKELRQLVMPAKEISPKWSAGFLALRFAPDGKTLLTGGQDGVLRLWDPAMAREIRRFSGFAQTPSSLTFAPDGKNLALMDGSSTIRQIRLNDGKDIVPCRGHCSGVSSVTVTPDCQFIVTSGSDGTLRFWEPHTGRELRQRAVAPSIFWSPQLQSDGRTYVAAGSDRTYRLHDLKSGDELAVVRGFQANHTFALSPDRKTLASINADREICLFDLTTGTVRHTLVKVKRNCVGIWFTADGRTLVVWDDGNIVTVWDSASGKRRRQFRISPMPGEPFFPGGSGLPCTAALSPDGRLLAVGMQVLQAVGRKRQGILPVLETANGKEICRFTTGTDGACKLVFSPDGKSLAWGGWIEGAVYFGEIASGGQRQHFTGHHGKIESLAFSPDGKMLISGSEDATALVWDLTGRLASNGKKDKPLSADDLKRLWDALAAEDAATGFRAIQALSADLELAVPYLQPRLHPVAAVDEERLKRLISDLDSEQFAVRDNASMELDKLGEAALHALRKAAEGLPNLESRRRLDQLIEKQEREEWKPTAEKRRTGRALEVLERAGTAEARHVLAKLAGGAPAARSTFDAKAALERLAKR